MTTKQTGLGCSGLLKYRVRVTPMPGARIGQLALSRQPRLDGGVAQPGRGTASSA